MHASGLFRFVMHYFCGGMYAVVDIETTGGNPNKDKITEIAVVMHDGNRVLSEFSTLVNPECRIPHHIISLTGITNEMVANAPRFFEIARGLIELTDNAIFVAHNVGFDYGFVRGEFRRLGYDYKRDQLCTVKLSRRLIPGHRSYSLGRLCDELNIPLNGRHRALGDAAATARLLGLLVEADALKQTGYIGSLSGIPKELHPDLDTNVFKKLPEEPGIYFFYNKDNDLIYIGKSKNIRNRILSHFNNNSTSKALRMRSQIASIGFETTGSELVALLSESAEIKKHKPLFNRAQRRSLFQYGLYTQSDENGYINFCIGKTDAKETQPMVCFTSKAEAIKYLNGVVEKYELCQKLCGRYPSAGNCFHYEIGACHGACIGKEKPSVYNARAQKLIVHHQFGYQNLLIIDSGRNTMERSVVKIENGKYIGFGYFSTDFADDDASCLHNCIQTYPDNREVQHIIKQYLRNNRVERIITY